MNGSTYALRRRRQAVQKQLANVPAASDAAKHLLAIDAKIAAEIDAIKHSRSQHDRHEVLYFPYSRILDPFVLRLSVLLFERIWFLDFGTRGMQQVEYGLRDTKGYYPTHELSDKWKALRSDYDVLMSNGVIGIASTDEIASDCEAVIGETLLQDITDERLTTTLSQQSGPNLWAMAVGEFPWSSTARAISVLPPMRPGKHSLPGAGGHGYVLLDVPDIHGTFSAPPPGSNLVFLSDLQGASIRTTEALIFSAAEQVPLFTDQSGLVDCFQWRARASSTLIADDSGPSNSAAIGLGLEVLRAAVDRRRLTAMPLQDLLRFRNSSADSRNRFWAKITQAAVELSSFSVGASTDRTQAFVATKILPELREIADAMIENYETTVGGLLKKAAPAAAGGATVTAISQALFAASTYELLGLVAGAAAAGAAAAVPIFVDAVLKERRLGRHGLVYALRASELS